MLHKNSTRKIGTIPYQDHAIQFYGMEVRSHFTILSISQKHIYFL